jgi:hypothetical protein
MGAETRCLTVCMYMPVRKCGRCWVCRACGWVVCTAMIEEGEEGGAGWAGLGWVVAEDEAGLHAR